MKFKNRSQSVRMIQAFLHDLINREVLEPGQADAVMKEWRKLENAARSSDGKAIRRSASRLARLFQLK